MDVNTRTNLKKCIALRVGVIFSIFNDLGVQDEVSIKDVEAFLCNSNHARKSQQYFMKDDCDDTILKKGSGAGCNRIQHRCFIISQDIINESALEQIRHHGKTHTIIMSIMFPQ